MKIKIFILTSILLMMTWLSGCSDMNDKHDIYLQKGEHIYIGKVDSLHIFPGDKRVQIRYWVSDPRCKKVGFYWYPENDSLMAEIAKSAPLDSFEVMIGETYGSKSIAEGSYTLKIITYDEKGNYSIPVEKIFNVYGETYRKSLINRPLSSINYSGSDFKLSLDFSEFSINESEIGVDIFYTNREGEEKKMSVSSDSLNRLSTVYINQLDPKKGVTYQTKFLPEPQAVDTFITEPQRLDIVEIINVALKKPVRYSDKLNSSYPGELAVDGIIYTTPSRWVSTNGGEHWLEIDLQEEFNVFSIQTFIGSYGPLAYPVENFMYQVEVDGEWVTVADVTGNTDPGFKAEFPEVKTSKVRYFVPNYSNNMVRMYEIEVYAKITY